MRFGSDKLLHTLADGTPMVLASARNLQAGVGRVLAVVRSDNSELKARLAAAGVDTVDCHNADEGMGASLACGIAAAADARGWLIALADTPFIRSESIRDVAAALDRGAALAALFYQGRRGHPVGFSASFRDALLALAGDEGARSVVAANLSRLCRIDCDDPGILADVDLPADLDH